MERQSFLFRKEWCDAVSGLSPKLRLQVYEGIINYALHGEPFEPTGQVTRLAFINARPVIDRDNEELAKREIALQKCREAGKRGGRPKKDSQKPTEKGGFLEGFSAENASPSRAHVIGDNKNNNQQDIEKDKLEKIKRESKKRKNEKPDVPPKNPPKDIVDAKAFIAYFNTELEKAKAVIPHNCSYTEKRDDAIHARVREHGRRSLQVMVQKAAKSDFLNGKNDRTFVAFLDWLLRPNNFVKVIEGNYDNGKVKGLNYKVNSYGNKQQYDRRRGVDAEKHRPEEY